MVDFSINFRPFLTLFSQFYKGVCKVDVEKFNIFGILAKKVTKNLEFGNPKKTRLGSELKLTVFGYNNIKTSVADPGGSVFLGHPDPDPLSTKDLCNSSFLVI